MNHNQAPQSDQQETFRGVTHDEAAKELGHSIVEASLKSRDVDIPGVIHERHSVTTDRVTVGDYHGSTTEIVNYNNSDDNLHTRAVEAMHKTNRGPSWSEIAVDTNTGETYEHRYGKQGGERHRTPSTRRLMAADRLVRRKFDLDKREDAGQERKAA